MISFEALLENNLFIERCSVFKWAEYQFSSGEIRDKFWLTLNCKLNDFPINIILPTSQYNNHHYSDPKHLIDCVIIKKGESQHFYAENTILDLKNIVREDERRIREAYEDGYLTECGPLETALCQRLEEAIDEAETLDPFFIDELLCREQ